MTETKPTKGLLTDRLNNTRTKNRPIWLTIDGSKPTNDWWQTLHESFSQYHLAILTNHVQRNRLITSSTDKHHSLDSEDDFHSGCQNISHQQQFFSELPSPGRSQVQLLYFYEDKMCFSPSFNERKYIFDTLLSDLYHFLLSFIFVIYTLSVNELMTLYFNRV